MEKNITPLISQVILRKTFKKAYRTLVMGFETQCVHVCGTYAHKLLFFFFFFLFRAAPTACGGSQASGQIEAAAASPHHSHSNAGSMPYLQPTPQLLQGQILKPTEQGQGSNWIH